MAVLKSFVEILELAGLSWLHPSDLLTFTSSLRLALLLQNAILCSQLSVLLLGQGQAQGNYKVFSKANLCDSFALKLLDTLRRLTWKEIAVAELANIVGAPGVASAGAADYSSKAHTRDLEVLNIKHLGRLDPMRRVELSKGAFAPNVKLTIC